MGAARARLAAFAFAFAFVAWSEAAPAIAGPPYLTDDPEPPGYRNWEIYTGVQYQNAGGGNDVASLPFAELNYGALPNVQVSLTLPLTAAWYPGEPARLGAGGLDFGIKTRLVQETASIPAIAFYPSVNTPLPGSGAHAQTFLPLWSQKSWGAWTAFGGGGLYLNAGAGERNYLFGGAALERTLSPGTTIGAELFHSGSSAAGSPAATGSNIGAIFAVGDVHAILFSVGTGFAGPDRFTAYGSYEYELGPKAR